MSQHPYLFQPLCQCQNTDLQFCNLTSSQTFQFYTNPQTTPSVLHRDAPMKHNQIPMNPTLPTLFMSSLKWYEKIRAPVTDPKSKSWMSLMALILESSEHFLFSVS